MNSLLLSAAGVHESPVSPFVRATMKFSTACRGGVACLRGGEAPESRYGVIDGRYKKLERQKTFLSSLLRSFITISAYFPYIKYK